ncbi:O-methyltransferase, partial [Streptococcus suis]
IDINEEMIGFAKENFDKYDYSQQIELLEGEAMDILPTLQDNTYDFIFIDSAKSKTNEFLTEVMKKLNEGGIIIFDEIF